MSIPAIASFCLLAVMQDADHAQKHTKMQDFLQQASAPLLCTAAVHVSGILSVIV